MTGHVDLDNLRRTVTKAGVPCGKLSLLREGTKRYIASDRDLVVVRVNLTSAVTQNSPQEELDWAARIGTHLRIQQPLLPYPLQVPEGTAAVWEWVAGKPLTAEYAREHGRILRVLHEQTPMPAGELLVITDQLESAKLRLEAAPASGDKKGLLVLLDRVEALLAACNEGDIVPSHGDAHDANILLTEEGLVLLDFDTAGPAPRLIDVASGVYSWGLRHNDAAAAREFIDGYGMHELVTDEALRTLVWVRRFRAACTRLSWGESLSARLPELLEGPKAYW